MTSEARTLIVGLGKTGLSCARFLAAQGVRLAVTDSREHPPGLASLQRELPTVERFLGGFNAEALLQAERVVVSPGVSLREPAISRAMAHGIPVLGDIELFARQVRAPIAAITGSNGKSTVTTLLGMMAARAGRKVRVGGNLGVPALELLEEHDPELYVLELSSFQLETTSALNAKAAVVLNISPDHRDRYQSIADYAVAKQRIYRGDGVMIVNNDDPLVASMAESGRKIIRFGLATPAEGDFGLREFGGERWLCHGKQVLLPASELQITGSHNVANALASLALGHALGLPRAAMLNALREFTGLEHRTQWVAERDGIQWYNDSKGTNIGATLAALQGLASVAATGAKIVLIAGGDGKGADFSLLQEAARRHARAVVLIGRDAALIEAALTGVVPVTRATDMIDAVSRARQMASPSDAVLLSPACASFDMYSGFEERGRVFMAAVQSYLGRVVDQ